MHYLDASFAVSAFTNEMATRRVQRWIAKQAADTLAISPWVVTEFASALSIKVRRGSIDLHERRDAMVQWASVRATAMIELPITAESFYLAAELAGRHTLGLRAGDALHIAVAAHHNCTLVTLDRIMTAAALEAGVPVATVEN
jgi:uncharacterized protein